MGRYKNGINGPFSGKVGTVVGASWRGIDYIRSVGDTSKINWSDAQANQRLRFALVMNWLSPLLGLINIGYQLVREKKTPLNAAVSYHLKEAVVGAAPDFAIDFVKAIFSIGALLGAFVRELVCLSDQLLLLTWDNVAESVYCAATDRATVIVYNPSKRVFVTFKDEAGRGDREALLQLPAAFAGDEAHAYLYFVSAAGDQVSTSMYLGMFKVQ